MVLILTTCEVCLVVCLLPAFEVVCTAVVYVLMMLDGGYVWCPCVFI